MERYYAGFLKNRILGTDWVALIISALISLSFVVGLVRMFNIHLIKDWGLNFVNIYNQIALAIGKSKYILLQRKVDELNGNLIPLILLALIVTWVVFLFIENRNRKLVLIFPFICIGCNLFFSLNLHNPSFFVLLGLTSIVAFDNTSGKFSVKALVRSSIWILIPSFLIIALWKTESLGYIESKVRLSEDIKQEIFKDISALYYGDYPVNGGDLGKLSREIDDGDAMKISMDKPDSLYLRGFVGETFHRGRWESLSNNQHYDNINHIHWLNQEGFSPITQLAKLRNILDHKAESLGNIKIENISARKDMLFLPYETMEKPDIGESYSDSFIKSKGFGKIDSYHLQLGSADTFNWTETAGKLFTEDQGLREPWLKLEHQYNSMVYKNYLHIDDADRITLYEELKHKGAVADHMDYKEAIQKVRSYISEKFVYTEKLPQEANEETKSSLERLVKEKKGYDSHFATLGTLMFRYYGIPARYVEGYIVTKDDVKQMKKDEAFNVSKKKAHSWCEIYIDGIGFVPIEVSPKFIGLMKEADLDKGISRSQSNYKNEDEIIRAASKENSENNEEEKAETNGYLKLITILLIFLILALFLLKKFVIWATKKYRFRNVIRKSSPKEAICILFDDLGKYGIYIQKSMEKLFLMAAYSKVENTEQDRQEAIKYWKEEKRKYKKARRRARVHKALSVTGFKK